MPLSRTITQLIIFRAHNRWPGSSSSGATNGGPAVSFPDLQVLRNAAERVLLGATCSEVVAFDSVGLINARTIREILGVSIMTVVITTDAFCTAYTIGNRVSLIRLSSILLYLD